MRRSLVGIVPDEILNRKRKAFIAKTPLMNISRCWANLMKVTGHMVSNSAGVVDSERFLSALQKARCGEMILTIALMRTIIIEQWLRDLCPSGILELDESPRSELTQQASHTGLRT